MPILESLLKAKHRLQFALGDLRAANAQATAVQSLVLIELIRDAAQLEQRVAALSSAIDSDTSVS